MRFVPAFLLLTTLFSSDLVAQSCQFATGSQESGHPIAAPPAGYRHDRYGTTPVEVYFAHAGYVSSFDSADDDDGDGDNDLLGIPHWVAYEMRRYTENGEFVYPEGFERPRPWYTLPALQFVADGQGEDFDGLDQAYSGEGQIWNRGHLATRSHVNRISPEAGCNTHFFINAVPQFWLMNQGDWNALERYQGALANRYGAVWAIQGPIFNEGQAIETVGDADEVKVAVPHALFKILVLDTVSGPDVRAFVMNQPTKQEAPGEAFGYRPCFGTDQAAYNLTQYQTTVGAIEVRTDLIFFSNLSDQERQALQARGREALWQVALSDFARPCGSDADVVIGSVTPTVVDPTSSQPGPTPVAIRIARVFPNPHGSNEANQEAVHIVNDTDEAMSATDWVLSDDDGNEYRFSTTLFPGETRLVLERSAMLTNSGDVLELRDSNGTLVTRVRYRRAGQGETVTAVPEP